MPGLRLPDCEIVERGKAIYREQLQAILEPSQRGRFVAIDVETVAYEVADETMNAMDQLQERVPEAQIWVERIGFPYSFKARRG